MNINLVQSQKVRLNVFGPRVSNPLSDSWAKDTDGYSSYSSAAKMLGTGQETWNHKVQSEAERTLVTSILPQTQTLEQQAPVAKSETVVSKSLPQAKRKPTIYIDEEALKLYMLQRKQMA